MKYKLKNKELEDFLNKFVRDFDKCLQDDCMGQYDDDCDIVVVYFYNSPIDNISIRKSDIYEIQDYDPNTWNKYPEVTPPEGVLMRVEAGATGDRRSIKSCAVFVDGDWCEPNSKRDPSLIGAWITRFRPWEDD